MGKKIWKAVVPLLVIALMIVGGLFLYRQMTTFKAPTKQEATAQEDKENAINGQWQASDDFVCDIWRDRDGTFHASITLTEDADTVTFWECSGRWSDDVNGFEYSDGVKQTNDYDADGGMESKAVYDRGKGSIYLKGDKVYWDDRQEQVAKKKAFSYVGEY